MPGKRLYPLPRIGDRYGRLTVIAEPIKPVLRWTVVCQCDCGNEKAIDCHSLRRNLTTSCGCLQSEITTSRNLVHGESETRLYNVWSHMKSRCHNRSDKTDFKNYGGRGIRVCDEWLDDYPAFRDWALANGYRDGLEIDRVDNDGNYEPGNCRWVTHTINNQNKRNNRFVTAFGETKTMSEWERDSRCQVCCDAINKRITKYGWTPEMAISAPGRSR